MSIVSPLSTSVFSSDASSFRSGRSRSHAIMCTVKSLRPFSYWWTYSQPRLRKADTGVIEIPVCRRCCDRSRRLLFYCRWKSSWRSILSIICILVFRFLSAVRHIAVQHLRRRGRSHYLRHLISSAIGRSFVPGSSPIRRKPRYRNDSFWWLLVRPSITKYQVNLRLQMQGETLIVSWRNRSSRRSSSKTRHHLHT